MKPSAPQQLLVGRIIKNIFVFASSHVIRIFPQ
jgi:hypothetical protein